MRSNRNAIPLLAILALAAACSGEVDSTGGDGATTTDGTTGDGGTAIDGVIGSDGSDPGRCGQLVAIVRDFKAHDDGNGHPDFENVNRDEPGYTFDTGAAQWTHDPDPYLDTSLDAEGKPKYLLGASNSPEDTIHGETAFSQWYRDVDQVNMRFEVPIADQDPADDRFLFDAASLPGGQFFPIDERGFGNEGRAHNYHFTTELRGTFRYRGGEQFTFSGDDDVYVFVNGKLALDIGGVHGVQTGTIDFDAIAGWLGIAQDNEYEIVLFHAERHTTRSNFRFETSIRCLVIN